MSVSARANRVVYDRGVLREWYAAGPLGIEQGFTLARQPAGADGPLSLALGLSGSVHGRQMGSQVRFLTRSGAVALRYGGLSATDASGRRLRAALALHSGRLLVRVWDRGARYPLRIDPLIQQAPKLTGSGEAGPGQFGYSVALSADGNTALIGGPYDNGSVGAAWVFTRSGSTWTQQGSKLTPSDETVTPPNEKGRGRFGVSVALSADGNTALIGGYYDSLEAGAAWVFTRSGSTWTQQGPKLTSGTPGSAFGYSVALSADGNTALIGGPDDNPLVGAAWVFTRSGSTWTQQGPKLTASDETGNGNFGYSVALSTDGNTALIGGPTRQQFLRGGVGVHALGLDLDPARPKAHPQRRHNRRLDWDPGVRLQRGAVHRRQHGPNRRPRRQPAGLPRQQRLRWGGVGVHALGLDLDPAGPKAHRPRRDRARRKVRPQRGAIRRRRHGPDRRP